jgi:hypothetical protein
MKCVKPGDNGCVENFFEGMAAGLAGFELDQVQNLVLSAKEEIVEAHEYFRALGKRPC